MERVEFIVEGSKGDEYQVVFELYDRNINAYCTCQAGQNGLYCKHRFAMMDGDVTTLLSDNVGDVIKLKGMLAGSDVEAAYQKVLNAQKIHDVSKWQLTEAKKALARAMYR